MKNWNVILGVDVSKLTLDISCAAHNLHLKIENSSKGFGLFKKWCNGNAFDLKDTLVVLEFTGGYEYRFIQFCESQRIAYTRISGLEIKNSMGMIRGKNDQVDAFRISRYGEEKIKRLTPSKPLDVNMIMLKQLLSFRKRLVRERAGLDSTLKERKHMYGVNNTDLVIRIILGKIKSNNKYIQDVEQEIIKLIKTSEGLLQNYRILTSIKGIGKVNAWMTLAYTENFNLFADARKYAVYVGVIPFERSSGTSVKGRPRVSHMAQKELKQELNQAAKTAMAHDPEIIAYAERKLQSKCYKLVLNNVKFKLILRIFSLIKRGEMYVENYKRAA
ncbi:transposase [Pedobacter sp.]|uniref:transposase n=1 Tax=Pedobacter sp. TaxID=1411316 RepID=UPI002CDC4228|nr:transposase [Pedobacter sp.]HWW37675.1 transposase [Pedobacter sp.]